MTTHDNAGAADQGPWPFDTTQPHPARRYDYWLGGKDNFAADRQSAERIARVFPGIRNAAVENRRFLQRVVAYLTGEAGIAQFVDIGTGFPTAPNVHEVAQGIVAQARVVYVDNDPIVVSHARALLCSNPAGATAYLQADLRDPKAILTDPALQSVLDLSHPVGLLLIAVLHFLDDADEPYSQVAQLVDALPAGSYLALSHATFDPLPTDTVEQLTTLAGTGGPHGTFRARTHAEVSRFVDGMTLVEPGLCSIVNWLPDQEPRPTASEADTAVYGAVARL